MKKMCVLLLLLFVVFTNQTNAQISLCNGSLSLDGTDDVGRISSSFFDTIPNQQTFTIEFYIKLGNNPTRYPTVWSQYGNGTFMGIYPCYGVKMVYKNGDTFATDSAGIREGAWEHYAVTGDGQTSKLKIYRNGVLVGTTNQGTPDWNYVDNSSRIGAAFDMINPQNSWYLKGNIDDFRVSRTIRYVQDFTPPQNLEADADTRVLYTFNAITADGLVLDLSGNNNHLTLEGGATIVADAPYSGGDGLVFKQSSNIFPDINAAANFWVYSKDGNATYQWQANTGSGFNNMSDTLADFSGIQADTLHITRCKVVYSNYLFRCIVRSGICSDTTTALSMKVCGKIIEIPQSVEALGKDTIKFTVGHTDTSAQFRWQKKVGTTFIAIADTGIYAGTSTNTLQIINTNLGSVSLTFRCYVKSGVCSDTIPPVYVLICGELVSGPESVNAIPGSTATFTTVHTDPQAQYRWQVNSGSDFIDLTDTLQYSGTSTQSLNISNTSILNNFLQFRCIIKSASCVDTTSSAQLKVCGKILSQPLAQKAEIGKEAQFVVVHNDPEAKYQWQLNIGSGWSVLNEGGRAIGSRTSILKIVDINWSDNGYQFRCITNSVICADTSIPAVLSVCGVITKQPKNTLAAFGKNVSLTVKNNDPNAFYQWHTDFGQGFQKLGDAGQYSGSNDSSLIISKISLANNGQPFKCIVRSNECIDTSEIASLLVCGSIEEQPFDMTVLSGEDAFFVVKHNDSQAMYRWQTDFGVGYLNITAAGQYSGSNEDTLKISFVSKSNNNQKFRCITSSNNCIDTSQAVTLFVNTKVGDINAETDESVKVYPNPAHDKVYIMIAVPGQKTTFAITDLLGTIVLKGSLYESSTIDIQHLQPAVYFIHIDNQTIPIKLIKN